jgi:hypothetical protein
MDNLRGFLVEDGWSDWISYQAFFVHQYLWLVIWNDIIVWFVALAGVLVIIGGLVHLRGGFGRFRKRNKTS